jgi:WhiB family redox-sensing transcriptional regulator
MRSDARRRLEIFTRYRDQGMTIAAIARQMGMGSTTATNYSALYRRQEQDTVMDTPITWPVPAVPVPGVAHWSGAAACRGHGDLFYAPEGAESVQAREVREAKARSLCAVCPVRDACAGQAEEEGQAWGIWSGVTEDEREQGKRQRREEAA